MYQKIFFLLLSVFFFQNTLSAQKDFDGWLQPPEDFKIEPFFMTQLWSSYTFGQEVFNQETNLYEQVDNRANVMFRRARLGFRVQAYKNLKFTLVGAYDLVGRDVLSGTVGGANNGSLPEFDIWDAFVQWKISQKDETLNLVGGYFRPQLSRESITSGWSVNSMEKSMSQNYIRRHLVGYGPGRALGLNLGGLWLNESKNLGLNYNVGIFNPVYTANSANSQGSQFAPLLVGRMVLNIGDPEMTKYKIGYDINYYGQRRGLSLGLSGSWQGETILFQSSYATEMDFLLNLGPLNLDGEWNLMWRQGQRDLGENAIRDFTYASNAGHIRMGYNVVVGKMFLEPSFMIMEFNGGKTAIEQADASAIGSFSGSEATYDLGVNWYLNKKRLKLMLHYTWHEGDAGDAGAGATVNQFFSQSSVGAIRRGDWLGLGMNIII
jgi:hypothetical protein